MPSRVERINTGQPRRPATARPRKLILSAEFTQRSSRSRPHGRPSSVILSASAHAHWSKNRERHTRGISHEEWLRYAFVATLLMAGMALPVFAEDTPVDDPAQVVTPTTSLYDYGTAVYYTRVALDGSVQRWVYDHSTDGHGAARDPPAREPLRSSLPIGRCGGSGSGWRWRG